MKSFYKALILIVSGLTVSFLSGNLILSILTCLILGALLSGTITKRGKKQKKKQPLFTSDEFLDKVKEIKMINENHDEDSLNEILEDSLFFDQKDLIWSIGTGSLLWYRLDGNEWVNDTPQSKLRHIWRSSLV